MKKILTIGVLVSALSLTSCNSRVDMVFISFDKVHISTCGNEPTHFKFKDRVVLNTGSTTFKLENDETILLRDGTYMLYDSEDCPICGEVQYK